MTKPPIQDPVQDPEKAKTGYRLVHFAALLLLSVTSAGAAGSMIGITQYNSVVIAAVVPVLLTAGWGIISLKFTDVKHDSLDTNLIAITISMIFFLYFITYSANSKPPG